MFSFKNQDQAEEQDIGLGKKYIPICSADLVQAWAFSQQ